MRETRAKERIDAGYTRVDPLKIAELSGVAVMFQRLDRLLGAYINEDRPGIIVNVDRPPGLVHMTCAHELGHHFLNHEATSDIQIEYSNGAATVEQEADQFAYSLLAPTWLLNNILRRKGWTTGSLSNPSNIYQLSLRLGVSFTSMVWTLNRLKIISKHVAHNVINLAPKELKLALTGTELAVKGHADVWLLDSSDRDVILEPRANDVFVLELENNAGAGYCWSVDEIRSAGYHVEVPSNKDVRTAPVDQNFPPDTLVGRRSSMRFTVSRPEDKAIEYGTQTPFSMIEHRRWQPSAEGQHRYNFAAEYEQMSTGLTSSEKSQRIEEAKAIGA
ncbi:ImmA/IrrE family metallo-endopeptidase [Herbaspirillum frisingense]|uniref:ImmA/IrrE family metallo-endopeptidase n=1 Tax=Herbaspirillum frisingense TaxID=92645 RepID=UPI0039B12231